MRYVLSVTPWLLLWSATNALGQYGLSGAPAPLWAPQQATPVPVAYNTQPVPYNGAAVQTVPNPQTLPPYAGRPMPASSFARSSPVIPAGGIEGPYFPGQPMAAAGPNQVAGPPMQMTYVPAMGNPALGSNGGMMEMPGSAPSYAQPQPYMNQIPYGYSAAAAANPAMQPAPPSGYATGYYPYPTTTPSMPNQPNQLSATNQRAPMNSYRPAGPVNGLRVAQAPGAVNGGVSELAPQQYQQYAGPQPMTMGPQPMAAGCGCSGGGGYSEPCSGGCNSGCCNNLTLGCCGNPWYASVTAMMMFRDAYHSHAYSYLNDYDSSIAADPVTQTHLTPCDVNPESTWGGEVKIGRRFACDHWAVEGIYWGIQPFHAQTVTPVSVSNINLSLGGNAYSGSQIAFMPPAYANPQGPWWAGQEFLMCANQQRYRFWNDAHSVEINLVSSSLGSRQCETSPWDLQFTLGARYFHMEDRVDIDSASNLKSDNTTENTFANYAPEDALWYATISQRSTNDLMGGQLGISGSWYVHPTIRLFAGAKFGVFDNYIQTQYNVSQGGQPAQLFYLNPTAYNPSNGVWPAIVKDGVPARANSTLNEIAFLSQLDVGADWNFAANWSLRIGYRLVSISGLALASDVLVQNMQDLYGSTNCTPHNGGMIMHGAFAGITWNF